MRGVAYGMHTIRVDGNDIFAIYNAVKQAREIIIKEKRPALIEAMSFRVGDHSTSDYSQRYRDEKEMQKWKDLLGKLKSPIQRLEAYMLRKGLIKPDDSQKIREEARTAVRDALRGAIDLQKPPIDELFGDVYDKLTPNLVEQKKDLKEHLRKHGDKYDLKSFKDGEQFPHKE